MISNHSAPRLSELDIRMAKNVPPGGNWKDIPLSVPSARLDQIRESCAAGKGSRSTYYGRLNASRPSFTVSTYYNRPGNGCFLHHDFEGMQHRTISHREAARLQSFPDSFEFLSTSQRSLGQQIGNAVPPLLAYQIAQELGEIGETIDLFSGAGGLALGFQWAGWQCLSAVDMDKNAVNSFNSNIANVAFAGDLNDLNVHEKISAIAGQKTKRLALIGGPPCQGFSTGGKKRSVEDVRNQLHEKYTSLLKAVKPDVFVFENVLGLLSLDKGAFFEKVKKGFESSGYEIDIWRFNASNFGIPQRRKRVIVVGVPHGSKLPNRPKAWTRSLFTDVGESPYAPTVSEALDDLPRLEAGQNGENLSYLNLKLTRYQELMRGIISPQEYLNKGLASDCDRQFGALRGLPAVAE